MTIKPFNIDISTELEAAVITSASEAADLAEAPEAGGADVDLAELLSPDATALPADRARTQAAEGGLKLPGSDGLPQSITKRVIEAAWEAERGDHLAPCPCPLI